VKERGGKERSKGEGEGSDEGVGRDSACTRRSSSMACGSSPVGAQESDVGGFRREEEQ
jgi:hypothetical protein